MWVEFNTKGAHLRRFC